MSKKMRYLVFVLLLIVPMVLAACGGDDDDDKKDDDVKLNQDFTSEMGVSFKYPEGWAAAEDFDTIYIANKQELLDQMQSGEAMSDAAPKEGEFGAVVVAMPLADMGMEEMTLDDLFEMMTQGMTGEGMTPKGDAENIKIGGNDARKLGVSDDETKADGVIYALMDDGVFVMMVGLAAEGKIGDYEATALKIAETIQYTAPAAE